MGTPRSVTPRARVTRSTAKQRRGEGQHDLELAPVGRRPGRRSTPPRRRRARTPTWPRRRRCRSHRGRRHHGHDPHQGGARRPAGRPARRTPRRGSRRPRTGGTGGPDAGGVTGSGRRRRWAPSGSGRRPGRRGRAGGGEWRRRAMAQSLHGAPLRAMGDNPEAGARHPAPTWGCPRLPAAAGRGAQCRHDRHRGTADRTARRRAPAPPHRRTAPVGSRRRRSRRRCAAAGRNAWSRGCAVASPNGSRSTSPSSGSPSWWRLPLGRSASSSTWPCGRSCPRRGDGGRRPPPAGADRGDGRASCRGCPTSC